MDFWREKSEHFKINPEPDFKDKQDSDKQNIAMLKLAERMNSTNNPIKYLKLKQLYNQFENSTKKVKNENKLKQ